MADLYETLKSVLNYEPDSGIFTWKINIGGHGCIKAGSRAGFNSSSKYRFIKYKGRLYREHRLAYEITFGAIPDGFVIDHINGIQNDNRICNLRIATHQQNIVNGKHRKNNTSGRKGVSMHSDGRWRARLFVDGHSLHLGLFESIDDAHEAYLRAAKSRFGEFARSA